LNTPLSEPLAMPALPVRLSFGKKAARAAPTLALEQRLANEAKWLQGVLALAGPCDTFLEDREKRQSASAQPSSQAFRQPRTRHPASRARSASVSPDIRRIHFELSRFDAHARSHRNAP
jgi:hypothetical protein